VLPAPSPLAPHGTPARTPLPAAARPDPPSRPPRTHSFSSARSPKKEPFSSTVILLLPSSLWEEQRERGRPVTRPAGQPHPCPGDAWGWRGSEDGRTRSTKRQPRPCRRGGGRGEVPGTGWHDQVGTRDAAVVSGCHATVHMASWGTAPVPEPGFKELHVWATRSPASALRGHPRDRQPGGDPMAPPALAPHQLGPLPAMLGASQHRGLTPALLAAGALAGCQEREGGTSTHSSARSSLEGCRGDRQSRTPAWGAEVLQGCWRCSAGNRDPKAGGSRQPGPGGHPEPRPAEQRGEKRAH